MVRPVVWSDWHLMKSSSLAVLTLFKKIFRVDIHVNHTFIYLFIFSKSKQSTPNHFLFWDLFLKGLSMHATLMWEQSSMWLTIEGVHFQIRYQARVLKFLQWVRWSLLKIWLMQNQRGRLIWALLEFDNVIIH